MRRTGAFLAGAGIAVWVAGDRCLGAGRLGQAFTRDCSRTGVRTWGTQGGTLLVAGAFVSRAANDRSESRLSEATSAKKQLPPKLSPAIPNATVREAVRAFDRRVP